MPRRFYCPQSWDASRLTLGLEESHHLLRVLRAKIGDEVVLFDGTGREALAVLVTATPTQAEFEIGETRVSATEPLHDVVLATAVPKGDRFSSLIEKAVELGVTRFVPLRTKRSIVDPGEGKLARMRQVIVAASKQCGRSRLMDLAEPMDLHAFLAGLSETNVFVADPSGEPWSRSKIESAVAICVGPEGGFTPDELELALSQGATLVSLGPRILRIETAALAMVVLL
jgi:16S rRNA (uracil1498-N3)-methyltransferase